MVEILQPQDKEIEPYETFFKILEGIKLIGSLPDRAKTVGMLLDSIDYDYYHCVIAGTGWSTCFYYIDSRSFQKDGVSFWFARQYVILKAPPSFKDDMMKLVELGETKQQLNEKRDIMKQFTKYNINFLICKPLTSASSFTYSNEQSLVVKKENETYIFWTFSILKRI